jgi:hypothetical protein
MSISNVHRHGSLTRSLQHLRSSLTSHLILPIIASLTFSVTLWHFGTPATLLSTIRNFITAPKEAVGL